jgi:uracil-DNA glycosylase family protein
MQEDATAPPPAGIRTLKSLRAAEAKCTRCPLYRDATQVVPGEGAVGAPLMVVGEQPGQEEDLAGRPFVGPAGRLFDRALADAGLDRRALFVTNAVKHFKFEPRGKRRLHKRPNAYEIERCRWWFDIERAIIRPALIVALGATAVRSMLGRTVSISQIRGRLMALADGTPMLATVHPSYLLRIRDAMQKAGEYRRFVEDLRTCAKFVADVAR